MRPLVMGIVNVTPDSFAEPRPLVVAGKADVRAAVDRGLALVGEGADIIDVGGESTRPGATPVTAHEEQARVLPVVDALVAAGIRVSIDTRHASTAAAAIQLGADVVNDVSCGGDPKMFETVAAADVTYVLTHNRGSSADMYEYAHYDDIGVDVARDLSTRAADAESAGIRRSRLIVDPGIGFAKVPQQNWDLLGHLEPVQALALPMLLGVSRKRFLGDLLAGGGEPRNVEGRDVATAVLSFWAAVRGVWGVRVHDVRSTVDALKVASALDLVAPSASLKNGESLAARAEGVQ